MNSLKDDMAAFETASGPLTAALDAAIPGEFEDALGAVQRASQRQNAPAAPQASAAFTF